MQTWRGVGYKEKVEPCENKKQEEERRKRWGRKALNFTINNGNSHL